MGVRRALLGLGAAGMVLGLVEAPLIATSEVCDNPALWTVLTPAIGYGFLGVGLYAWWRRPDNRVGALMVATAFAWFVAALAQTDISLPFTAGNMLGNVFVMTAIHLALAYPSGRVQSRLDRAFLWIGYPLTAVILIPALLFLDPQAVGCVACPENLLLIDADEELADTLFKVADWTGIVFLGFALARLWVRWKAAGSAERTTLAGVLAASAALIVLLDVLLFLDAIGVERGIEGLWYATLVPFGLVPWIFLAGLARTRILRSGAVSQLVARLAEAPGPGELRDALARALGDPQLTLAYWLVDSGQYVDVEGRPVELPEPGSRRVATPVEHDGVPVAAIMHDAALADEPELVEAAGGAAALALENERLGAELRARLEELRASRARLVEAGVAERRRLERDLHDGAQQRLVSLALDLRLAEAKVRSEPAGAESLLAGARAELDLALGELRELARGIHPAVLSDRGLRSALEGLVGRAPLPVRLERVPEECLTDAVESAAYFVVAEALTNVAKYADAKQASVSVARENGHVLVEVQDDGVGGADPKRGSGLRGLADRVSALDGRLVVESPPGRGTTVKARIPCA